MPVTLATGVGPPGQVGVLEPLDGWVRAGNVEKPSDEVSRSLAALALGAPAFLEEFWPQDDREAPNDAVRENAPRHALPK